MLPMLRNFLMVFLGFTICFGSLDNVTAQSDEYLNAEKSDPKAMGWMQGSPPLLKS